VVELEDLGIFDSAGLAPPSECGDREQPPLPPPATPTLEIPFFAAILSLCLRVLRPVGFPSAPAAFLDADLRALPSIRFLVAQALLLGVLPLVRAAITSPLARPGPCRSRPA
jgi:hypothetical protein